MVGRCCYNKLVIIIIIGEEKRKTREWSNLNFCFKTIFLGIYTKKKPTHSLFGAWSLLLVHMIRFTQSEGPKGFVNLFF